MATSKYKRILLKLSGESLQGKQNYGHDVEVLRSYAEQIKRIAALGVEIGIVIGGGNIFRGIQGADGHARNNHQLAGIAVGFGVGGRSVQGVDLYSHGAYRRVLL